MKTTLKTSIFFFITTICLLFCFTVKAQNTIKKNGDEYFNGDDRHIYAYLNNNYNSLDDIEGIWLFSRIELNNWGGEISRTNNEFQIAIVRDHGNVRRAFIEINLTKALCKKYRVIYSIQTGGNGVYPCLPEGCMSLSSQYVFNSFQKTISREAISLTGNRAVLVGVKIFPQGPPKEKMRMPGGVIEEDPSKVTDVKPRTIKHKSGWEAYIDWGQNIFPSYILSMGTLVSQHPNSPDYLGDPLSNLGILIDNPRANADVRVEIEATRYTKAVSESFTLPKRGMRYAIFPKVAWEDELLKQIKIPFNLHFTFKVWINNKPAGDAQTLTPRIRSLDDCPFIVRNYKGEKEQWHELFAAYVNEAHPKIKDLRREILDKKWVSNFSGAQRDEATTLTQVFAFWQLLREKGYVYSSIADNGETTNDEAFSQRVRLFEDVVEEKQANCIDGTVFLASCLKEIGINPVLVIVPGHAFLGYYPNDKKHTKESMLYLETTKIGNKTEAFPQKVMTMPEFLTIKKALTDNFNKMGVYVPTNEIDYFAFASVFGALEYEVYKKESPNETFGINMAEVRQRVKPITRLSNTYMPVMPQSPSIVPQQQKSNSSNSLMPNYQNQSTIVVPTSSSFSYQGKGTNSNDNRPFNSNAPLKTGTYYKVQLAFIPKYDSQNSTYKEMQKMGRLDLEFLMDGNVGIYRALIGDFNTYEDAVPVVKKAKSLGFDNAHIVQYQEGNRGKSIYKVMRD